MFLQTNKRYLGIRIYIVLCTCIVTEKVKYFGLPLDTFLFGILRKCSKIDLYIFGNSIFQVFRICSFAHDTLIQICDYCLSHSNDNNVHLQIHSTIRFLWFWHLIKNNHNLIEKWFHHFRSNLGGLCYFLYPVQFSRRLFRFQVHSK